MKKSTLAACLLAAGLTQVSFATETTTQTTPNTFTDAQRAEIQKEVKRYLVQNPEILIQMSELLQAKETAKQQQKADKAVPELAAEIFSAENSPISGNPTGDITVVEFFDYQCGHCRRVADDLNQLVERNENVRVVYKAFPIFGDISRLASKVAMAANAQGKFQATHDALMDIEAPFTKAKIMAAAKASGLDMAQLKKDLDNPVFEEEFKQNYRIANAMGIVGTPSFVISTPSYPATKENQKDKPMVFIPGAVNLNMLEEAITKVTNGETD